MKAKRPVAVVVPAVKKNAAIPDQPVKRLAGITLVQRALDTALAVVPAEDVLVVTDSQEIGLICERNGVRVHYNQALQFYSADIVTELRDLLREQARLYDEIVVYRASCPLLTGADISDARRRFRESGADCMVTVRSVPHRIWEARDDGRLDFLLGDGNGDLLVESRALVLLRAEALLSGDIRRTVPYFLNDRAIEINGYQDWWICERLLARRHVVFVVTGYPAVGMGHVYRSLMLAHEITDHKITFVCTRESELAAADIAARDYRTLIAREADPGSEVLALRPDLVINDMLDTPEAYVRRLKEHGAAVVNFEDEGPGADLADLVVNALYEERRSDSRRLCGHRFFCLRDEFLHAQRNVFRPRCGCLLITFGGTDAPDYTRQTLEVLEPLCRERNMEIRVVTGPGYAHREALEARLAELNNPKLIFTGVTNVMSRMMEGADLAVCSAGRTVYELAHMRIPGIVLAQHAREARHTFARAAQGFAYLGVLSPFRPGRLRSAFLRLVDDPQRRQTLFLRQERIDFTRNKTGVVRRILSLLE